jgi:hypothetical protein
MRIVGGCPFEVVVPGVQVGRVGQPAGDRQ